MRPVAVARVSDETKTFASSFGLMPPLTVSIPTSHGVDWKGLGYLTSIASVLFLGAVAWVKDNAPWWYYPALIIGMATSVFGMGFRYKSHLDQQREIKKAQAEAEQPKRNSSRARSRRPT